MEPEVYEAACEAADEAPGASSPVAVAENRRAERRGAEMPPAIEIDSLSEPIDKLLGEEDAPVPWIVEGLVAEGSNGFIAAEPKVGKSWLGLLMAVNVSTGKPLLGFPVPTPRRVLYIQEEDSRRRVRHRLGKLMRGQAMKDLDGSRLHVIIRKGLRIDDGEARANLEHVIKKFVPELVIVDVFNSIHTADETSQEKISAILSHFTALTRHYQCAFLLLHHFRKAGTKKARARGGQAMRGSSALHGWSENSLYLSYVSRNRFEVEVESKDEVDVSTFSVAIQDTASEGVRLERYEAGPSAIEDGRWKVIQKAFGDGKDFTSSDAAKHLKSDKKTVQGWLKAWASDGRLVKKQISTGGPNGTFYYRMAEPITAPVAA